jgi:hypothetical protein
LPGVDPFGLTVVGFAYLIGSHVGTSKQLGIFAINIRQKSIFIPTKKPLIAVMEYRAVIKHRAVNSRAIIEYRAVMHLTQSCYGQLHDDISQ